MGKDCSCVKSYGRAVAFQISSSFQELCGAHVLTSALEEAGFVSNEQQLQMLHLSQDTPANLMFFFLNNNYFKK